MVKTAAEKQRDYRERQSALLSALRAENEALRVQLETATADLRAEAEGLRMALADAEAEIERLSKPPCPHPSERMKADGTCGDCGEDMY